ncbi:GNRR-6 protein [Aphelenchoides avenae]|nr:GNRR-6 protein [Aphelenchus avenae]
MLSTPSPIFPVAAPSPSVSAALHELTVTLIPSNRDAMDQVEIAYLYVTITLGTLLNMVVLAKLLSRSKTPTASTSFLSGPYQVTSFTLFKIHLSITDFAILLIHALGKAIWLTTYEWKFGLYGCKAYQLLSAFSYYSNSNIVVAIGLDRLKIVYTSHVQGATSIRRARFLLTCAWLIAALCALPQLFVWTLFEPEKGFFQCTTVWAVAQHQNLTTPMHEVEQVLYELCHQAAVFWIPSAMLAMSYLLIVFRVVHYSLRTTSIRSKEMCRDRSRKYKQAELSRKLISLTPRSIIKEYTHSSISQSPSEASSYKREVTTSLRPLSVVFACVVPSSVMRRTEAKTRMICCGTVRPCCFEIPEPRPALKPATPRRPLRRYTIGSPAWKRQLRSRISLTSFAIVIAHFILWLPYNMLNSARFVDLAAYERMVEGGWLLLEDLIVLNSVLNPILYSYGMR